MFLHFLIGGYLLFYALSYPCFFSVATEYACKQINRTKWDQYILIETVRCLWGLAWYFCCAYRNV